MLPFVVSLLAFSAGCAEKKHPSAPEPALTTSPAPAPGPAAPKDRLEPYSCGTVERLHTWNGIFAGSQPAAEDLRHAKENGIQTLLNLRPASEDPGFDEAALTKELGLEYHNLPFASPVELTDAVFDQSRALLRDQSKRPMFVHCHSGNRVGAIWLAFRVLDGGLAWEAALAEAKDVGLKTPALEKRAREYVEHVQSANPPAR